MSHLSPDLARRIDRLARRAHCFHRFAHHPLCPVYAGEVWAWGRCRVCRGCTLMAAGLVLGLGGGALLPGLWPFAAGVGLAGFVTHLLHVRRKGLTRFAPGLALPWVALGSLRGGHAWAAVGAAMLSLLGWAWYRRKGPTRGPCSGCVERDRIPHCAGTLPIRRREKAFGRLAGRWIEREAGLGR